jgi:hypothetical protein
VRVYKAEWTDVSDEFLPGRYDVDEVDKRLEWAGRSRYKRKLLVEKPERVDWLIEHPEKHLIRERTFNFVVHHAKRKVRRYPRR